MRKLLIMRHAKSSWDNPNWSDFERPLNSRGLKAAPFMGNIIYHHCGSPDVIVSSPAKRAKQTAVLVKEPAGISDNIVYKEQIYEASPTTLLYLASEFSDNYQSILLIGHNPGLEDLIRILTGEINPMPTASIAKIYLDINKWSEIAPNCGKLKLVMRPRDLMQRVELN